MIAVAESVEKDRTKARALAQAAVDAGDKRGLNTLGIFLLSENNYDDAIAKFDAAAEHNVANALKNATMCRLQLQINMLSRSLQYAKDSLRALAGPPRKTEAKTETKAETKEEKKSA